MISLMHESQPRGHLLVNGQLPTDTQLTVLAGCTYEQLPELICELENAGVFSRTAKGVIYSRRMTRDEKIAIKSRKNGKTGGNPTLCNERDNKSWDNPKDNPTLKPKSIETRVEIKKKDICPKSRKRISYPDEFNSFWLAYPTDANMSKKEAWQEWGRLDDEDKSTAFESLKAFNAYCNKNSDYRPIHANRYLKYRRFDGHAAASAELVERQTKSKVHLIKGTPPFDAWNAYKVRRGQRPISRSEWWFPTEWPPGHENSLRA